MSKTFYFPIESNSLAHYFGCACIKPAKYFEKRPSDIQNNFDEYLLLTDRRDALDANCCLELVLTEQESDELFDLKNGCYLYGVKPLPISRVRKIYFIDEKKKETTITNIEMSTAFIPKELVEVIPAFKGINVSSLSKPKDCVAFDQFEQIKKFDRYLGALALMRLAREEYMNYSENYIATLALFNSVIENELPKNAKERFHFKFQDLFAVGGGGKFETILPYLKKVINNEDLQEIARKDEEEIKKDLVTRLVDYDKIEKSATYTIAILNGYGVEKECRKQRVDDLIASRFNKIKEGKSEGVALCYGYNRGYSVFTKAYGANEENKVAVKFELNSQLDYYTIESIYQYVFNRVTQSGDFSYLDWCPRLPSSIPRKKTDYKILDTVIIGKKKAKVSSPENWKQFLTCSLKSFDTYKDNI